MGIRMTQMIGLRPQAQEMVRPRGEVVVHRLTGIRTFPDGRTEAVDELVTRPDVACEPSGRFAEGMFGEQLELQRYTLKDGRALEEHVQEVAWSSGPCIFLALKDPEGEWVPGTRWSRKEIQAEAG